MSGRNSKKRSYSVHNKKGKEKKLGVKCSFSENCSFVCATRASLKTHLKSVHRYNVVEKKLHFKNRSEFEKWKEEEEKKTGASYVTDTGAKKRKDKKIFYLRCHRSGASRAEQNKIRERLRSRPGRGYTQCGSTCPSSMQVVENQNGSIDLSYFPNHLGHKMDDGSVRYMRLRRKERDQIAARLVEGETVSTIIREARGNRSEERSRINFLQRRDVYNIRSKVIFLEREIDEDLRKLDIWISELRFDHSEDNPIALYKPMNDIRDYMLVVVHNAQKMLLSSLFEVSMVYVKTKKRRAHIDYNLTGVYVINEMGHGYPVGFCISRKSDYPTVLSFFKVLFNKLGQIKSPIFVSDDLNFYYLAWKRIMGEAERKFICNFNLASDWDVKLPEWKCPLEKQRQVSQELKSLLHETNQDVFNNELLRLLNYWYLDKNMRPFVNSFVKNYCKKMGEWANCFRIDPIRKENINVYLQPLDNQMKEIYGDGNKKIMDALHSMFAFIKEDCYINVVKNNKVILQEKVRETEKNHAESEFLTDVTCDGSNGWIVRHLGKEFNIKKGESDCNRSCYVLCEDCTICLHSFNCDCIDYTINFKICIHIHALVKWISLREMDIRYSQASNISAMALKLSAVSLSQTITDYLERSELYDFEYDQIILDLDNVIRQNSLKERFEESLLRRNGSTSD